jgi:cyclopropane fatty-acyl-phospholipid synthase-like methyltransferase
MNSDANNIIGLYRRHATAWARLRGRDLTERKWLDRFIAHLPAKARVLDIGCGTGEPIARYLLEARCDVTGIDAAPEMIDIAKRQLPGATWRVSDMRSLELNETFNGLLAWNSFFHLAPEQQRQMFPIFARHAADGAALMFTSGPSAGEAIGTFEREPLYHASLAPAEYRQLLDSNGFDVVDHVVEDPDCGRLTIWIGRLRQRETA